MCGAFGYVFYARSLMPRVFFAFAHACAAQVAGDLYCMMKRMAGWVV